MTFHIDVCRLHLLPCAMRLLLWTITPYVALTMFALGHIWRYRSDKFGWITRSSQLHEQRLLRLGSPLFHSGSC